MRSGGRGEGKQQGGKSQLRLDCALAPCMLSVARSQSSAQRLLGTDVVNLPANPSEFSFQTTATPDRIRNYSTLRKNHVIISVGKDLWRSLIQLPAQSRATFNVRSGCSGPCSVKFWKSPKTVILQPVLAPVPLLIHPRYENIFLLCPAKHSGSPKLLQIQPQKC